MHIRSSSSRKIWFHAHFGDGINTSQKKKEKRIIRVVSEEITVDAEEIDS